jgi:hypothetical protein
MNPIAMIALLVAAFAAFGWTAGRRWQLLHVGKSENRLDRLGDRALAVWRYAFKQEKMDYYQPAGIAHKLIFFGFVVLLFRTLVLWGRGFSPSFNLFVLQPWTPLGQAYEFAKDSMAILVLAGVSVFFYFRLIKPQKRMTLSIEGAVILGIIATMMLADMTYDGASSVLTNKATTMCFAGSRGAGSDLCASILKIVAPYVPPAQSKLGIAAQLTQTHWELYPSPAG